MTRLIVFTIMLFTMTAAAHAQDARLTGAPRVLIAFFSHTNNTRTVAEEIQRQVGGDLFHIATKTPYPKDHRQTVNKARHERDNNLRPELTATMPAADMRQYDIVFIGYPNWWMSMPMAVRTFVEQHDLAGKTIVPFCTHEGSGPSNTVVELREMVQGATVLQGLAVSGRNASRSQTDIANWLRSLRLIQ